MTEKDIQKHRIQAQAVIDQGVEECWRECLRNGPHVSLSMRMRPWEVRFLNDEHLQSLLSLARLGHAVMCHQKMENTECT